MKGLVNGEELSFLDKLQLRPRLENQFWELASRTPGG